MVITCIAIIVMSGLLFLYKVDDKIEMILLSASMIFITSYFSVAFALEKYFYTNLRMIYNNIFQLKSAGLKNIEPKIPSKRIITEINRLLIEWEKDNREEIVHLKELETYRKEFLGNVSHELKTPIFTIQGYIHTLLDGGIEDLDVNLLYLKKAGLGIDRLISIVDDLESISKLEAGELILEKRTFDFAELLSDVLESLQFRASEKKVNLFFEQETKKSIYVYADKERIRQVLINLLENSIKYGKEGGTTSVIIEGHNEFITVDVKDDGLGVEKKDLNRLFERFYRVDKSRSRDQGGTGLGLAIVKHIMEAHDQNITVHSEYGQGTTFTFTLQKSS